MNILKSKENVGILFIIVALLSFSILDAIQKYTVINHSIFQILMIKYLFVLFLSVFESRRKKNYIFYNSKKIKFQILRSLLSVLESGCFVLSFRYLSLADVHSIGSMTPVIVVALSALILREYVSIKIWIAIFVGFVGMLIILRPGSTIFNLYSLIPLCGAFFLGFYQIVTRKVSKYDSNETSLFYTGIIGLLIMFFLSIFYWQPVNLLSVVLLGSGGVFFSLGIYFQILALSNARASIIQPFHYTLIFWAILFGYILYNDVPDIFTICGVLIIVASGTYVLLRRN